MKRCARIAIVLVVLLSVAWPAQVFAGFSDYVDLVGHWARDAVEDLYDAGAVDEPPPLYRPDVPIDRGKFAKYLVLGWDIERYTGAAQLLSDVPPTNPYFVYANSVYLRGVMVGSGSVFGVGDKLTREQCATVLVRAAGLEPVALQRPLSEAQGIVADVWSDAWAISSWAVPYMAEAYVSELFEGDAAGTVRPRDSMNKAEAATVVSRMRGLKPLLDLGDAPDWPTYFNFPSLLISNGARHKDYKQVWLGERADGEIESRQVNSDFFDDGFVRFNYIGLTGAAAPLTQWEIEFEVSVASRDPSLYTADQTGAGGKLLYFNFLLDHSMNMAWEPPEWLIQNFALNPNTWPAGQTMATYKKTFALPQGVNPYDCWFRLTLTWGEPLVNWVGKGLYVFGETEDYGPEEQKILLREEIKDVAGRWSRSGHPTKQAIARDLTAVLELLDDLIAEERADDPVEVLIAKKEKILARLYQAAQTAVGAQLSQADVDVIFKGLWKRMAFIAEEEVKRYNVHLLRETLRLNFNIPADCGKDIQMILAKFADLIYEQERGDPVGVLLEKKEIIIFYLERLIKALEAAKLIGPAVDARAVLAWMLWLKAIEVPLPPGPGPLPPPGDGQRPPWEPPEDGQPPSEPPGEGPLSSTPKLPGTITGVQSVFTVSDGRIRMKVHLTNLGPKDCYDVEIYADHQRDWPASTVLDPVSGPPGWTAESGPAGVGWYGDKPLVACQPYYFEFDAGDVDPDSIIIVLTDENHEPIGSSGSQRVYCGTMVVPPEMGTDFKSALKEGDPIWVESFFDIFFTLKGLPGAPGPQLLADAAAGGGIYILEGGLPGLEPGGYVLPIGSGAYSPSAPALPGAYYGVCDHTGAGYALLQGLEVSPNGCYLWACWNPSGTMIMEPPD